MRRLRRLLDFMFLDGFNAAPRLMWAILGLTVVNGLAQATFPLGFKLFVDAGLREDVGAMVIGVAVSGALIALFWLAAMLDANVGFALVDRMELYVSTRIAERVNEVVTVEHFERPEYLQELDLLTLNRYLLRAAPRQTLTAISSLIRGGVMCALMATVHPVMAVVPLLGLAPGWAQTRSVAIRQRAEESVAEMRRLSDELFELTSTAGPAKELRVYGLTNEFAQRHHALGQLVSRHLALAAVRGALVAAAGWTIFVVGFVGGIALVVGRAIDGAATPGEVVLAVVLAQQVRQLIGVFANDVAVMLTTARTAGRALWLDDYAADAVATSATAQPPSQLRDGIEFRDVTFRYPGTETEVLQGVNLWLPAGSSVAIVGENGAGKTTLIKLLSGMYQPTTGHVLVDGSDLRDLAPTEWRACITATFQDFVPFEVVASEAVGIGDLPRIDDLDAITGALAEAHATDVVDSLGDGLATQLGRSFPNGRELSGGQWQKLALGRSMMRREPLLLILDEPTASLDAETEHALFERYLAAARRSRDSTRAITVLVSHRFSTVRAADTIVVIDGGNVAEMGSHDDLVARNGLYAELFRLQARAYA